MTTTYCTENDVKRYMALDMTISEDTTPSINDVQDFIEEAEDDIDHQTQDAWRSKTVVNEFYDIPRVRYNYQTGIAIHLRHTDIKALTNGTDKLEIWDGSSYVDWLATKTEGRNNDYWLEETKGILYLRYPYRFYAKQAIRLTYRYGKTVVPGDIKRATAMIAAINLLLNDDRSSALVETGDPTRISYNDRASKMQARVNKILKNHTTIIVV